MRHRYWILAVSLCLTARALSGADLAVADPAASQTRALVAPDFQPPYGAITTPTPEPTLCPSHSKEPTESPIPGPRPPEVPTLEIVPTSFPSSVPSAHPTPTPQVSSHSSTSRL
jgi:hypothetical protein